MQVRLPRLGAYWDSRDDPLTNVPRSTLCKSDQDTYCKEDSNAYSAMNIGVNTAENEPRSPISTLTPTVLCAQRFKTRPSSHQSLVINSP